MSDSSPILITGLSGFIARQTALQLLRQGRAVRGTVRRAAGGLPALLARHGADVSRLEIVSADLAADAGWDAAVAGCRHVLHMASPYPLQQPRERMALVPEARDGTLRILRAARRAGVARVVLTSSLVAVQSGHPVQPGRLWTEADWSMDDSPTITPYQLSKTLAERAAWDEVQQGGPELAVINPGFVLGPTLDGNGGTSAEVIALMLSGKYPAVPHLGLSTVDVRDVAAAHIAALTVPGAAGRRFIATEATLTLMQMAQCLAPAFPAYRSRLPKFTLPNAAVRLLAMFDRNVRTAVPELGKVETASNAAATEVLGIRFRPAAEAVVESARTLIEYGKVARR